MESDNLRTASVYINNLLLSRGLLKNGQNLDFAHPEQGEGGSEGTMGRIMGVVNDLILRRDRDATQRETLSNTLRTLRADSLRQTTDLTRLQTKHAETQRKLSLSEATERALKAQLRGAEGAARGLREEMGRMRVLVGQARAQCANEVRKRERVIEGLKKHVGEGGRARGSGKAVGVATVTIVAGVGGEGGEGALVGVGESDYDLRQETNEFLTELAKGLSEESENLGMLLRTTVESLKALSGWEGEEEGGRGGELVISVDDSYENVAAEIDSVIEHLRTLLTNPSFVPLEEVEVREDEIIRLREGWERMESRWRDAVRMMDGWRKRMATSGQTVNLEELKAGLELSPVKDLSGKDQNTQDLEDGYEEGDTQADIDAMDDSQVPGGEDITPDLDEMSDASSFEEEPEDFVVEPTPQITAPSVQAAKPVEAEITDQRPKRSGREARTELSSSLNTQEDNKKKRKLDPQAPPSSTSRVSKPRTDSSSDISTSRRAPAPRKEQVVERQQPEPEMAPSSSPGPPPQLSPLRPIPDPNHRRKSEFTTIVEENTWDFAQMDRSSTDPVPSSDEISLLKTSRHDAPPPTTTETSARQASAAASTPLKLTGASRLPRPASAMAQESPLTMASIAAKLAATEREADAARVRAKLKAAKLSSAAAATNLAPPRRSGEEGEREREPVKGGGEMVEEEAPRKRKASSRMGGRASRRRSTLSPWELESLILGGVGEGAGK
ncbi:hypothetical protein VE01_02219 [Pseudogymnoascus verrucosus]|uniref:NIMA interactive protein n=1 Tax=Pseudogymnoascus verrucosus TaxID=342668 RepID=A0A1B8GVD7_9PEZI|nr:uncharacterized protein VE01_02219 [Pseudogymnoascus verrucosus]OBT99812.1 hypothetical protein VE01_02219 [Pseudogymnoascus verrucosus]